MRNPVIETRTEMARREAIARRMFLAEKR